MMSRALVIRFAPFVGSVSSYPLPNGRRRDTGPTGAARSVERRVGRVRRQHGQASPLATQHVGPQPLGGAGQSVVGPGVDHEPGPLADLTLQLAGPPAGITGEQADLLDRTAGVGGLAGEIDRAAW